MARYVVKLPDIGEGTTEAEIVAWHVAPGQVIREEDPLVDVMTDKATVELPAPVAGTVVAINGAPGERRPVGSELVILDVAGEEAAATEAAIPVPPQPLTPTLSPQAGRGNNIAVQPSVPSRRERQAGQGEGEIALISVSPALQTAAAPSAAKRPAGGKPLASPAVRRRAWDAGIPLQFVPGNGPGGRVTQQDLDAFIAAGAAERGRPGAATASLARRDGIEEVPIVGLRRAIAEHLQQSKRHIPHFAYVEEVDVTALEELRAQLNAAHAERERLT
ncbi:MAG TPA: biotin/lipoyl-containing protein, partial [Stellaceae bacterium]|nr:biotin/lipoyl-containing protein [Stellaceae bacterium]